MITNSDDLRKYKKKTNFFETPNVLANQMAGLLAIKHGDKILEPSIGLAALIKAVEKKYKFEFSVDFCEIQDSFYPHLTDYNFVGSDFVDYNPGQIYDAIIMNPPYKNKLAEKHIDHAWDCLKPGGKIVALVGEGSINYIDEEYSGYVFHREEIKKAFKETPITVYLLLIHKPLY